MTPPAFSLTAALSYQRHINYACTCDKCRIIVLKSHEFCITAVCLRYNLKLGCCCWWWNCRNPPSAGLRHAIGHAWLSSVYSDVVRPQWPLFIVVIAACTAMSAPPGDICLIAHVACWLTSSLLNIQYSCHFRPPLLCRICTVIDWVGKYSFVGWDSEPVFCANR